MSSIDAENILHSTEQKILAYCAEKELFSPGETVIVACSGGADSMALLCFLLRCREELDVQVMATHVNHGIRGEASHADAVFVQSFCERWNVPFFLYDAEEQDIEVPEHPSEDWARRLRYHWFEELAKREQAVIATAHTLSDQTETLLFRMARGTGVHGMAGIRPTRGVYRRPFLCLNREETVAYCMALGQDYVQDETNFSDVYARNRLRHDAVPALEYANPAAQQAVGRLCEQMRELDEWLTEQAKTLLRSAALPEGGYKIETLRQADGPILTQALRLLIAPSRDAEQKYVALLRKVVLEERGAVQLTPGTVWRAENGRLCLAEKAQLKPAPLAPQLLREGEYHLPGGFWLSVRTVKCEEFIKKSSFFKKDYTSCGDYAKIDKNILLRTRQPGDEFRPAGRHCRKKLKKYLNEIAVPPQERDLLPLIARGNRVCWLWGSGFAEDLAPGADTETVLVIQSGREPLTEG